jgi:hypothetical protein
MENKKTIGKRIEELYLDGLSNNDILIQIKSEFLNCKTTIPTITMFISKSKNPDVINKKQNKQISIKKFCFLAFDYEKKHNGKIPDDKLIEAIQNNLNKKTSINSIIFYRQLWKSENK